MLKYAINVVLKTKNLYGLVRFTKKKHQCKLKQNVKANCVMIIPWRHNKTSYSF